MKSIHPDLTTKLMFGGLSSFTSVEISSTYEDSVWIQVYEDTDREKAERSFMLEPDEIDLFICILTMYKKRILDGRTTEIKEV